MISFKHNDSYKGFRLFVVEYRHDNRPKSIIEWIYFVWGVDVFFGKLPILKTQLVLVVTITSILLYAWR